ncbi:class I SAM-dependent methyltransferase [Enterococcus sp. LJL128]|uniref:class I SAM-dependent methyltransferase n=1 Tax=Enterococcus sp. LJL51 TaxID=3416656 RepID=UPI003CFB409C
MAIIKLTSTNPKLSYILYKNPESGLQLRKIRKGMGYGWYADAQTYLAYFTDQGNPSLSFRPNREEEFHYLNSAQYQAPLAYLSLLTEFFSYPFKQQESDTEGFLHQLELPFIAIRRSYFLRFFRQQFPDIQFNYEETAVGYGTLIIQTEGSLHDLLHTAQLFLAFQGLFGREFMDETEGLIQKYVHSLNAVDAPFYIRNLFAHHFLSRRNLFNHFKKQIETTNRYEIDFSFGGTNLQRRNFAESLLDFEHPILDVGCGEGYYIGAFTNHLNGQPYYAVDINPEVLAAAKEKAEKKELENVSFYSSVASWEQLNITEPIDIIMMEVAEHMPLEEAEELIQTVLSKNIHQMILSTPNKEFNHYYSLAEDQMRHTDHCWEMTRLEFQQWIDKLVAKTDYTIDYLAIGDKVNGISTTQGVRILRKNKEA